MNDAARQAGDAARQAPMVSGNQVVAAGFASAAAAFLTSRFGVAGTLLGAAITTMIITGGSAILKAYFESMTGNVRKVPDKLRARKERRKAERYGEPEEPLPERPDLRDNLAGRMRAALDWFSHLPPLSRRSILVKGLIAAAIAFLIGMTAVWGVERVINNSLSCGIWANCPDGAEPGIRLTDDGRGAGSSVSFGRDRTQNTPGVESRDPALQQQNNFGQDGSQQGGSQQGGFFQQQNRNSQQGGSQDSGGRPGGVPNPQPSDPDAPVQPETPNSASPAPESPAPGEGEEPEPEVRPQDASPSPRE